MHDKVEGGKKESSSEVVVSFSEPRQTVTLGPCHWDLLLEHQVTVRGRVAEGRRYSACSVCLIGPFSRAVLADETPR